MFSVREKPWHGLGTIVHEVSTSADAIRLAGLDWTVVQNVEAFSFTDELLGRGKNETAEAGMGAE